MQTRPINWIFLYKNGLKSCSYSDLEINYFHDSEKRFFTFWKRSSEKTSDILNFLDAHSPEKSKNGVEVDRPGVGNA